MIETTNPWSRWLIVSERTPPRLPNCNYYPCLLLPQMATARRTRFIYGNIAWMSAGALGLVLLNALELELFFVVSLIGFLVVTELTAPFSVTPAWRRRLRWLIGVGLLVFGYIVIRRILAILPPGVI